MRLGVTDGEYNPHLEILLYRNRLQLATRDALYSDGDKYSPALKILRHVATDLPRMQHMLMLGVGLGSFAQIVYKMGFRPKFTLVEIDKTILSLAVTNFKDDILPLVRPVNMDAQFFLHNDQQQYDLIFIDIFFGREVPLFVVKSDFLLACRNRLKPMGILALNYIINSEREWNIVQNNMSIIFPKCTIIESDIDPVFIAELPNN